MNTITVIDEEPQEITPEMIAKLNAFFSGKKKLKKPTENFIPSKGLSEKERREKRKERKRAQIIQSKKER
jgi:hypothetical protein